MKLHSIHDKEFKPYGYPVAGFEFQALLETLEKTTEKPGDKVIYVPSAPALEALPVFGQVRDNVFGGIPIQFGYCNGFNPRLNCLEYHRGSEVLVAADEIVLLVARLQDCDGFRIDSGKVEAFTVPKGEAVLYYETTLHYAPARRGSAFRTVIILPRETNTDKPAITVKSPEDKLLRARNKWLIAHPDAAEAKDGAFVGITGINIDIEKNLD